MITSVTMFAAGLGLYGLLVWPRHDSFFGTMLLTAAVFLPLAVMFDTH